jgi:hypothetical protein
VAAARSRAGTGVAARPLLAFLGRIRTVEGEAFASVPPIEHPTLAMLLRGDLALAEGSVAWALFRDQLTGVVSATRCPRRRLGG